MLLSRSCHPFLCRLLQCIITRYLFIIIIIIFCLSIVFRKAQVYQWLCVANDNSFITIQTSHPHTRKKNKEDEKRGHTTQQIDDYLLNFSSLNRKCVTMIIKVLSLCVFLCLCSTHYTCLPPFYLFLASMCVDVYPIDVIM